MALSDELQEATARFFVRTKDGKTAGGPYPTVVKLGAGMQRALDRGIPRDQLLAQKLVDGRFVDLSTDEKEAMIASME